MSYRQIKKEIAVNGKEVTVTTTDEKGAGGAYHRYQIIADDGKMNSEAQSLGLVNFQNGPILENGVNGVQNEHLISIVIDRLQCFQAGDFACRENALALTKLQEALHWLEHRTKDRQQRGVEGKNEH